MKAIVAATLLACAAWAAPVVTVRPVTREVYLMGTRATLTTWDGDRSRGLQRLERLLEPLERTEALLSTWRAESEVSQLNARAGAGAVRLSATLCAQVDAIDRLVRDTNGTFDPGIGALVRAWDIHGNGRVPSASELARARQHSGWSQVRFDRAACTLALPPNLSIDVGAFGKGEAIDRAREATREDEAPWLIDLGGQLGVKGTPPESHGWQVSVAHPRRRATGAVHLVLDSGSLATSAGAERDLVVDGRRVGHILDPRTGRPAAFIGSVTVWHESALVADALSTALYVMGQEAGLRWADERDIAACYLVPKGATVTAHPSRAFAARFAVTAS